MRIGPEARAPPSFAYSPPFNAIFSSLTCRLVFVFQAKTLDKHGEEIKTVGFKRFGFDSEVPLDVLRSLYLRPHYAHAVTDGEKDVPQDDKLTLYQSKSIFGSTGLQEYPQVMTSSQLLVLY